MAEAGKIADTDPIMAGFLHSRRRGKNGGWRKTSADFPNPEKASRAVDEFVAWMREQTGASQ